MTVPPAVIDLFVMARMWRARRSAAGRRGPASTHQSPGRAAIPVQIGACLDGGRHALLPP